MRRFFIPLSTIHGEEVHITGSDVHHLLHVLRKKVGDTFEATDGYNRSLVLAIHKIQKDKVICTICETKKQEERSLTIRLFQALPKAPAWEDILTKACELGVTEIIPLLSERTMYPKEVVGTIKPRWKRLVDETAKRVGRLTTMTIHPITTWGEISSLLSPNSLKIIPWEGEKKTTLRELLENKSKIESVDLIIGPEGGFSLREVENAISWGFSTVTLGTRILTTSTAVVTTLANIFYSLDKRENSHPQ